MNHTPGPWKAGRWMEDDSTGIVYGSNGEPVAIVHNVRVKEGPANQALIAQAPDLLAERDKLLLQVEQLQKGGDWMAEKLDRITRAVASGNAAELALALLMKPPQIGEMTWPEKRKEQG